MSIEILDKVMNEMTDAIAAETDPLKAEAIAKEFESKIDAAEKEMEEAIEKELKEADEALEKEFEASQVVDEIEQETDTDTQIKWTEKEKEFIKEIKSGETKTLTRKYKKSEFINIAEKLNIEHKGLKEVELVEKIQMVLNNI